jgi:hypothetical protein
MYSHIFNLDKVFFQLVELFKTGGASSSFGQLKPILNSKQNDIKSHTSVKAKRSTSRHTHAYKTGSRQQQQQQQLQQRTSTSEAGTVSHADSVLRAQLFSCPWAACLLAAFATNRRHSSMSSDTKHSTTSPKTSNRLQYLVNSITNYFKK